MQMVSIPTLDTKQITSAQSALNTLEGILSELESAKPAKGLGLREKQQRFAFMSSVLVLKIYASGYEISNGEGTNMQGKGHMPNSLHYSKLAFDTCLFKDDVYLTDSKEYETFGLWWEKYGGAWGGRFKDGNHFSIEHEGRK